MGCCPSGLVADDAYRVRHAAAASRAVLSGHTRAWALALRRAQLSSSLDKILAKDAEVQEKDMKLLLLGWRASAACAARGTAFWPAWMVRWLADLLRAASRSGRVREEHNLQADAGTRCACH
jgi:hypothetical protein